MSADRISMVENIKIERVKADNGKKLMFNPSGTSRHLRIKNFLSPSVLVFQMFKVPQFQSYQGAGFGDKLAVDGMIDA